MSDAALAPRMPVRTFRSKRLLALAGDERLVQQIRRGSELAFEVAFERHGSGILAFCRHMLGSREEAEDAVQHTFAAAFRDLQRADERQITLKPWLYTIARNRCVSVLRARREQTAELEELPTEGLHEQVARRSELRELLADLRELPDEQRAALLLSEAADLSHAEVAGVLGCEVARVKALVFRARSGLIERRDARETPCADIREQLANLRGGSLRRSELRHHLRHCAGCAEYREQVSQQRQMLAVALPVVPTLGLKSSVLSAAGFGGGGAGGVAAAAGGGAAAAGGGAAAAGGGVLSSLGSAAIAKVALAGLLAGGGLVAGEAAIERAVAPDEAPPAVAPAGVPLAGEAGRSPLAGARSQGDLLGERRSAERSHGRRGDELRAARSRGRGNAGANANGPRDGLGVGQTGRTQRERLAEPGADGRAEALARREPRALVEPKAPQPRPVPRTQTRPPAAESETIVVPETTPAPAPRTSVPGKVELPQ
jgi:RNA polymerase sigma factor (sigma-70 family)